MEKSKVYFTDMRAKPAKTFCRSFKSSSKRRGSATSILKTNTPPSKSTSVSRETFPFCRPNFAKAVADTVKELGGKPFLTDCNTLYVGRRKNALDHMDAAYENGFSPFSTGCHVIIADGLKGTDEVLIPLEDGEYVKEAKIGRAVMDAVFSFL